MSPLIKSILLGLVLGLGPLIACALLYYVTPYLVRGNPGALLSFAVLALYVFSSIAVIVVSIILLVRKKTIISAVAIVATFAQAMVAAGLLANA